MFTINKSYDFTTLAAAILGAAYTNMKVLGILTAKEASKHIDVYTQFTALNTIIAGLPVSADMLTYILFEDAMGNIKVIAQEYIDPATIVLVTVTNIRVDIFDVPSSTEAVLSARLKEIGLTNFNIMPL